MFLHARGVLIAMLAAASPLAAQVTLTSDAALNSQYQWRGITTTNRFVVQPDFIVAAPFGKSVVTAGAWVNVEGARYDNASRHISENAGTRAGITELDLWLEAPLPLNLSRVVLTPGVLHYSFPNTAGATAVNNTAELYLKAKFDAPFAPLVTVWYDVHAIKGAYGEVALSRSVGKVALGAVTGWNISQSVGDGGPFGYFSRRGFTHADLSIGSAWTVRGVAAAPALHVLLGSDPKTLASSPTREERAKVWLGTTLTWSRTVGRPANNGGGSGAGAAAAPAQHEAVSK